jgi:hypothetical protein
VLLELWKSLGGVEEFWSCWRVRRSGRGFKYTGVSDRSESYLEQVAHSGTF